MRRHPCYLTGRPPRMLLQKVRHIPDLLINYDPAILGRIVASYLLNGNQILCHFPQLSQIVVSELKLKTRKLRKGALLVESLPQGR